MKNPQQFRLWFKRALLVFGVLIVLELVLRLAFGFGSIPVYEVSTHYEYALQPSQAIHRFGNRCEINEAGMRSAPLKPDEIRIIKFGDSVLNGGIATDQDELASSILERRLSHKSPGAPLRVLNVSAGSWGPDNAYAWMMKHGHFGAEIVVLLFSSHDWQDQMSFADVVGRVPFYPSRQPALALTDAADWVYSRYFEKIAWNDLPQIPGTNPRTHAHNTGWQDFIDYTSSEEISLVVYHHANAAEAKSGAWTADGLALEAFLSANQVQVVSGLTAGFDPEDFRDEIHPNAMGQAKIADALEPHLQDLLFHAR